QMRMPGHEAWRKGRVTEVDNLRISRRRQIASGVDNFVALNNDDAVLGERFRFTVEKSRSFQNDDLVRGAHWNCGKDNDCNQENKSYTKSAESWDVHPRGIEISHTIYFPDYSRCPFRDRKSTR